MTDIAKPLVTGGRHGVAFVTLRRPLQLLLPAFGTALATISAAQGSPVAPPAKASEQRRAILDALRPSIEAELGPSVEFVPSCMQVHGGWAFVMAEPQRKGGRPIPRDIVADWENRDGLTVTALLQYRNRRWNLIDKAIGATDAWYDSRAPGALFRQPCS